MKLGIIQGSTRNPSNTAGITAWAESKIKSLHLSENITIQTIDLSQAALPYTIDPVIPQGHPSNSGPEALAASYVDPAVQAWSRTVGSWDAVLIITPQYNWGVPAPLKNAIDHLYHEWVAKPVGLFTIGGHGGGKCCESLRTILGGGLHANVAEKAVNLNLPKQYIVTGERVRGDEDFFNNYAEGLEKVIEELADMVKGSAA
ncbi:hypothetical protein ANO11243_002760 [Dothideomycetidae sp. 11243]|nr:hypothetical protein ANO11243_002760 [fungal sp. No.11243]